jgi:hypothetical protein
MDVFDMEDQPVRGPVRKDASEAPPMALCGPADQVRPARSSPVHSTAHHAGSSRLTAGRR